MISKILIKERDDLKSSLLFSKYYRKVVINMVSQDPKTIKIFHTHIEVSPYEKGENEKVERMSSVWDDATHSYYPMGYFIYENTLILPRGFNLKVLEDEFETEAFAIRSCDEYSVIREYHMTAPPKNKLQLEAINFLTNEGKYVNNGMYSQYALILDTGEGKTYTAIHSILKLRMKAVIITHQDKIRNQWVGTFLNMTDVPEEELIKITGSETMNSVLEGEIEGTYYFVNHQTLNSFAKKYGYDKLHEFFIKLRVGVKIIDEAHLSFHNLLMIDAFSDTKKTFYLTATFDRTDKQESRLFKRCFAQACKFDIHRVDKSITAHKRKHIIYVPVIYRSSPSQMQIADTMTMHGFSVINFSKYAFGEDRNQTILKAFFQIFDMCINNLDGRILVTTPLIEQTILLSKKIDEHLKALGKKMMVGTINSKNEKSDNEKYKQCADVICTTIKSSGTGTDIRGLRCVINLEPFSSKITGNQLAGRLREYAPDKDTYFFDLIDTAFPRCYDQYKKKIAKNSDLRNKCKEVRIIKL